MNDLDPLDVEGVRARVLAYITSGIEIEKLTASIVKSPFFERVTADCFIFED